MNFVIFFLENIVDSEYYNQHLVHAKQENLVTICFLIVKFTRGIKLTLNTVNCLKRQKANNKNHLQPLTHANACTYANRFEKELMHKLKNSLKI